MTDAIVTVWIVVLPIVVVMGLSLLSGAGPWEMFDVAGVLNRGETSPAPPTRFIPRPPAAVEPLAPPTPQIEWRQRRDHDARNGGPDDERDVRRFAPSPTYHAVALASDGRAVTVLCGLRVEDTAELPPQADWEIEWGVERSTTPKCPVCLEALTRRRS